MAVSVLCCVLLVHTLLLCSLNVHGFQPLDDETYKQRLYNLYEIFNPLLPETRIAQNFTNLQFAVLTAGNLAKPDDFIPSPHQFADVTDEDHTYLAAVPLLDQCPVIHAERQLVTAYNLTADNYESGTDFYILTYYSPCIECADILQNLAADNSHHNFYIGFITEYITPDGDSTINMAEKTLEASNIYFGNVSDKCEENCTFPVKIEDLWGPWGSWTPCTEECDGGIRYRYRGCCEGDGCDGSEFEKEICNSRLCAYWDEWGKWGRCSKTCGGGKRRRTRKCVGYGECPPAADTEIQTCNNHKCPKCFASDSMVRVKSNTNKGKQIESKRLDELTTGEFVESYDPDTNSVAFSQVYFINHEGDIWNSSRLLKLVYGIESGEFSLRLHAKHLVYACIQHAIKLGGKPGKDTACHRPPLYPVTAESVEVGDILWVRNSTGHFSPKPVIWIDELWTSVRHPMTFSHYIVVDDVLASVHMLDEWFYRVGTAPLRFLYNIHPSITDTWVVQKAVQIWDSGESFFV